MKNPGKHIIIGKIGATYGVHGWLKIHPFTEFGAHILEYKPWYLSRDQQHWQMMDVEAGRTHGNGIIVKLAGYDNPEIARQLTGQNIAIERSQLPALEANEFYWDDLVGLKVIDQSGQVLGEVIYLIATGSNDVLVVKGEKEHAIPFLMDEVILKVDLVKGEIHVDWEML